MGNKNEMMVFNNEMFGDLRVVNIDGEGWLVGKDVVEALGYDLSGKHVASEYIKAHCEPEDYVLLDKNSPVNWGSVFDYKQLGQRGGYLVNESGLYALVFGSDLPQAKKFKRWVTSEVLPQIRQTGGVVVEGREEEFITNYFPSFSDDVKKAMTLDLYHKNQEYKKQLEAQKPKVDYYDKVLQCDNLLTTTQVAKDLGMSAIRLNKILVEHKVIYKEGKCYLPYAKYHFLITEGYADYKITEHGQQLCWTEKGRKWIIELINEIEE